MNRRARADRYVDEFAGIPAGFRRPGGQDPNYRDGYAGMRMGGGGGRAPYGAHRMWREHDLETAGGFHGAHDFHDGPNRLPDPRWEREGMGIPHLRRLESGSRRERYGGDLERRVQRRPEPGWAPDRGYRPGYTNRGLTEAGYGEGWARGPMRGAR